VAATAGALGGVLVSGALWTSFYYAFAWLAAIVAISIVVWRLTTVWAGAPVAFLAGWCMFWGILTGAVAMWGAQVESPGWAYAITAGIGFLIGITHGNLDHADIDAHDTWFMASTLLAPAGASLAAWLYRHEFLGQQALAAAALTGAIAGVLFLGYAMALYMANWNTTDRLARLASLYLHHDDFVAEAISILDKAIRHSPNVASLRDRRALAHALNGEMAAAGADWKAHSAIEKGSRAPHLSQGWLHLRRGSADMAAAAFDKALAGKRGHPLAVVGRALASLRLNEPQEAIDLLTKLSVDEQNARNLTYLAEAHLMLGQAHKAIEVATVAIEELDSIHGLSWLVRAEAHVKLGNNDEAILDFNKALAADYELGINERTLLAMERIDAPVLEEEELGDLEKTVGGKQ
jgi:tetratricopeptide (TPR) repeat protein